MGIYSLGDATSGQPFVGRVLELESTDTLSKNEQVGKRKNPPTLGGRSRRTV